MLNLNWRFEAEVASKDRKNVFKPNAKIFLSVEGKGNEKAAVAFDSDFGNLKNLHVSLQEALKAHHSSKFKLARFSSV